MIVVHDTRGLALLRIAAEVRELLWNGCCACREGVPRCLVDGTDSSYVHWYPGTKGPESTCASCACVTPPEVFDDLDTIADVGRWLVTTQPIKLPAVLPATTASAVVAPSTTVAVVDSLGKPISGYALVDSLGRPL